MEGNHQVWIVRINLTQRWKLYRDILYCWDSVMLIFVDGLQSGAWPFLVGEMICQVDSVNERDYFDNFT